MSENLNDVGKYVDFLTDKLKGNNERLEELLQDERVKEFMTITKENDVLNTLLSYEMESCSHLFVQTDLVPNEDYPDGIKIYHCLKCGVTNEYGVMNSTNSLDETKAKITDLYCKTAINGVVISDKICSLEAARNLYRLIISAKPSISVDEIIERFSQMYSRNLGRKSAAELWYEMEERCDEGALATLKRFVENNGTAKIKK